jgi:hypothetical protein
MGIIGAIAIAVEKDIVIAIPRCATLFCIILSAAIKTLDGSVEDE